MRTGITVAKENGHRQGDLKTPAYDAFENILAHKTSILFRHQVNAAGPYEYRDHVRSRHSRRTNRVELPNGTGIDPHMGRYKKGGAPLARYS